MPAGSLTECVAAARAALVTLLSRQPLVTSARPAASELLALFDGPIPPSVVADVPRDLVAVLQTFEACVAHVAARADVTELRMVWPQWPFRTALAPVGDTPRQVCVPWGYPSTLPRLQTPADAERLVRWLLVLAYARAEALVHDADCANGSALRAALLAHLYETVASSSSTGTARIDVAVAGSGGALVSCGLTAAVEPWMLSRAVTGLLVHGPGDPVGAAVTSAGPEGNLVPASRLRWPARDPARRDITDDSDPRARFFSGAGERVPVIDLHAAGLAASLDVSRLDETTVLATPYGSTRGWRIDQAGVITEDDVEWPILATGVIIRGDRRWAWGTDDAGDAVLAWWAAGTCIRAQRLPRRCTRVTLDDEGLLLCGSLSGEVTQVQDDSGEIVGELHGMPGLPLTAPDGAPIIGSVARREDGALDRRLDGVSWRRSEGRWHAMPHGPLGPAWAAASLQDITAVAYPHADLVDLRVGRQPAQRLAVYAPRAIAWAGSSLVVANVDGEVLIFTDLADALRG